MRGLRTALFAALVVLVPRAGDGAGHGPVFGAATPTLGRGGWSLDQAWMGRVGERPDGTEQMLRTMISFGITEDLQSSGSLPIALAGGDRMPMGRMMAMMPAQRDVEALVAWRFHRQPSGEGARFESTAYAGGTAPLDARRGGVRTSPSAYGAVASGYASRAHCFWAGAGYQRYADDRDDRLGDVAFYSLVYGYRPKALRLDYPKPDLRFFVEAVGEKTGRARHGGMAMPRTGGHVVMVGPTALLLYKAYGIEGGVQFPVYENTNGGPGERMRVGVNVSYFFWPR